MQLVFALVWRCSLLQIPYLLFYVFFNCNVRLVFVGLQMEWAGGKMIGGYNMMGGGNIFGGYNMIGGGNMMDGSNMMGGYDSMNGGNMMGGMEIGGNMMDGIGMGGNMMVGMSMGANMMDGIGIHHDVSFSKYDEKKNEKVRSFTF